MRIAIVGVEANKSGGVERYVYELTYGLGAELFASSAELKFHRMPSIRGPDILYKNSFPIFAQLLIKSSQYDVIHSAGASYLTPVVTTALTSQPAMRRLLARNEIFLSIYWLRKMYWQFRLIVPYVMERLIYSRAIPIIAISNLLKNELVNTYKVPSHRIHVIYPGVNLQEFRAEPGLREKTRKSLNLEGTVIIFVGSQWGRKGLKFLLEAVRDIGRNSSRTVPTLLVVGGRNEVVVGLKPAPTSQNVRFLGFRENLCELYNAADIFVFPSLFDGFGLPVIEAMACGLPVVVSRFAGASEIVGDGGIIINNPRDQGEIREKILMLMRDEPLLRKMGKKARNIAENYSWEKMVQKIREIYFSHANI